MIPAAFIDALADAGEDGSLDLEALRQKCLAAIGQNGDGTVAFTTRAGLNGKAAEQECRMDASELLVAVNQAIRMNAGTHVSLTYTDFSYLV